MTTLTGIRDAQYLAQFLGGKIAIRIGPTDPIKATYSYWVYPSLESIHANKVVKQFVLQNIGHSTITTDELNVPTLCPRHDLTNIE